MKKINIILVFILFFVKINAQNTKDIPYESWFDYEHHHYFSEKLIFFGDATFRFGETKTIGVRPSARYYLRQNTQILGGIGLFDRINFAEDFSNIELRFWQGLKIAWPQGNYFTLVHHFRFEEQFTSSKFADMDFSNSIRFRYQLSSTFLIFESNNGTFSVKLPIKYEIFHRFRDNEKYFISRDRITTGITFIFSKQARFDLEYTLQRRGDGYSDLNPGTNIFRLKYVNTFFDFK